MPTDLPYATHTWDSDAAPGGVGFYALCRHCKVTTPSVLMVSPVCPDRLSAALAAAEARGRAQVREALAELAHAMAEAQAYASGYDEGWAGHADGLAEAIDTIEAALSGEDAP